MHSSTMDGVVLLLSGLGIEADSWCDVMPRMISEKWRLQLNQATWGRTLVDWRPLRINACACVRATHSTCRPWGIARWYAS